ncbi:unnamed protein product [Protopolystoma xenopodis]|uniref:Uncharacterized protein n=1 Tax=Protopolystoma xenopodis TaxID=117903 RepID=A0A3S5AJ03_9PLAT|nr:unnamed protein product [Protopolystoma xenopodis]
MSRSFLTTSCMYRNYILPIFRHPYSRLPSVLRHQLTFLSPVTLFHTPSVGQQCKVASCSGCEKMEEENAGYCKSCRQAGSSGRWNIKVVPLSKVTEALSASSRPWARHTLCSLDYSVSAPRYCSTSTWASHTHAPLVYSTLRIATSPSGSRAWKLIRSLCLRHQLP